MTAAAWQIGTLVYFGYLLVVAALPRGLPGAKRLVVAGGALAGAALAAVSMRLPADAIANVWILPPSALLVGYWTSGRLFVAPMPRAEHLLMRIDRALRIDAIAGRLPRAIAELLELGYCGVYLLALIGLSLAIRTGVSPGRFWSVVLLTDYICFGMLPWIQTRPPRALGASTPWQSRVRDLNLRVLDASSVQVNTFPSGHAAEAMALALLTSGSPGAVVAVMCLAGAAVSAGAVFGRYHYAADAIAGWAVALVVYFCFRL